MREIGPSVEVPRPNKPNRVVSLLDDQHSDDFFVPVDDEVPSEFIAVFMVLDQLLRSELGQMAVLTLYDDWDVAQGDLELFDLLVVNAAGDCGQEGGPISLAHDAALLRIQP